MVELQLWVSVGGLFGFAEVGLVGFVHEVFLEAAVDYAGFACCLPSLLFRILQLRLISLLTLLILQRRFGISTIALVLLSTIALLLLSALPALICIALLIIRIGLIIIVGHTLLDIV